MKVTYLHPLCRSLLLAATLASSQAGAAETNTSPPLPQWQVLEYEQTAFFVTAKSRVEIVAAKDNSENWRLIASSSVASNSEQVTLDLRSADGKALYRSVLGKGKKNQRYKTFDFLPTHIERVRRDPSDKTKLPPDEWPVTGRKDIPYPQEAKGKVVTDAYTLLALAGRFQASDAESAEVIVNTQFNFYLARMTRSKDTADIKVDYQVEGTQAAVSGKRNTHAVAVEVTPVGDQPDKYDFSLLGLNGDITILFDADTGLPLQLRGSAPRIGDAEIDLKRVILRNPVP